VYTPYVQLDESVSNIRWWSN